MAKKTENTESIKRMAAALLKYHYGYIYSHLDPLPVAVYCKYCEVQTEIGSEIICKPDCPTHEAKRILEDRP